MRFIHLWRADSNAFFLMDEQYSTVYMHHSFFTPSSVDGHLGCFHVLAVVNSAAVNSGIHVFPKKLSFGFGSLRVYA